MSGGRGLGLGLCENLIDTYRYPPPGARRVLIGLDKRRSDDWGCGHLKTIRGRSLIYDGAGQQLYEYGM